MSNSLCVLSKLGLFGEKGAEGTMILQRRRHHCFTYRPSLLSSSSFYPPSHMLLFRLPEPHTETCTGLPVEPSTQVTTGTTALLLCFSQG